MNTEQITTLQKLLVEIDKSMTRADAEKDLQVESDRQADIINYLRNDPRDRREFPALCDEYSPKNGH